MKIKWIVGGLLLTAGIVMLFVLDIVTGDVSVNDIWSDCDIKFQNGGRIATTVDCINTKIVIYLRAARNGRVATSKVDPRDKVW